MPAGISLGMITCSQMPAWISPRHGLGYTPGINPEGSLCRLASCNVLLYHCGPFLMIESS